MNLADFQTNKETLRCGRCGHIGLEEYHPSNGNHVGARCPQCGTKAPLAPEIWFSQNGSAEHVRRSKHDAYQVWEENGWHCSFCGKSWKLCELLHISRQVQHVHPVMFGGAEDGKVVPICSRCQEMTRPLLLETRDVMNALAELAELK